MYPILILSQITRKPDTKNITKIGSNDSSPIQPSTLNVTTTTITTDTVSTTDSNGPSCHKNPFLSPSAATAQFEAHTKQINELVQNYAMMQRQLLFTHQNSLYPNRSQSLQQNNDNNSFINSLQTVKTQSQSLQNLKRKSKDTQTLCPKPNSLGIPPPPQPTPHSISHNKHLSLQMIKPSMRHKRTVTPSAPALPVVHDHQMLSILNGINAPNTMSMAPPSMQQLNNMTQSIHRYRNGSTHTDTSATSTATTNTSCSSSSSASASASSSSSSSSSCSSSSNSSSCSCSDCQRENERRVTSICNDTHCSCHDDDHCTITICNTGSSSSSSTSSSIYSSISDDNDNMNGEATHKRYRTFVIHDD